MPQRILRDWTDSATIDKLKFEEEVLFTRLIMKADDFGNFHGDPLLVKSLCFPRRDSIRHSDISRWIESLLSAGVIRMYEVKGEKYLTIVDFKQRLRQRKRVFPEPVETCQQFDSNMSATGHLKRREEKRREDEGEIEQEKFINDKFFEFFRRAAGSHLSDSELRQEVGRFRNKYPNVKPNNAGALINTWVNNIGKNNPVEVKKEAWHYL